MAIIRPPKQISPSPEDIAADTFINSAPDGSTTKRKGVVKGKRQQISLTIDPEILDRLDVKAAEDGVSRAALINIAIRQLLNRGATVGGGH
ncbi:CopG family transcriptional regulator [Serratia ureilytica]|uniref:CopG family transcriptional regulator n=1 Tax=Serratia ureilytica TaxID=300181 RepID=UPI0034C67462